MDVQYFNTETGKAVTTEEVLDSIHTSIHDEDGFLSKNDKNLLAFLESFATGMITHYEDDTDQMFTTNKEIIEEYITYATTYQKNILRKFTEDCVRHVFGQKFYAQIKFTDQRIKLTENQQRETFVKNLNNITSQFKYKLAEIGKFQHKTPEFEEKIASSLKELESIIIKPNAKNEHKPEERDLFAEMSDKLNRLNYYSYKIENEALLKEYKNDVREIFSLFNELKSNLKNNITKMFTTK